MRKYISVFLEILVTCFHQEQVWRWVYMFSGFFDPHKKRSICFSWRDVEKSPNY